MNQIIFKTQFGSHIYGTNLPTSDQDFKAIFMPDAKDLVLQRAARHIENNTKKDPSKRNAPDDIDDEAFSLSEYLKLLLEGQTVALDMLFTPRSFVREKTYAWEVIQNNRKSFLHKGTSSFVGYTRAQAAKYGVKGFRVAALRLALDFLDILPMKELKLISYESELHAFVRHTDNEHIAIVECKGPNALLTPHLEVCNRKIPFHATVKYAHEVLQRIFDEYGHRARLAEKNEGVDWKALMHAVRVAREAEELLLTGNITFPRPERELLLKIRKAEMAYRDVASIIEEGLLRIEDARSKSSLPDKPDFELAEEIVYEFYRDHIYEFCF